MAPANPMETVTAVGSWVMLHWELLLAIAEGLWLLGAIPFVLLEQRSPVSTLAWCLALAALPIVGGFIYYTAGPRRLTRRKVRRRGARELIGRLSESRHAAEALVRPTQLPLIHLMRTLGNSAPEPATSVTLYTEADPLYDDMLVAIDGATSHVHVEFYIFAADQTGVRFVEALCAKARSGVMVRLLVDSLGTGSLPRRVRKQMEAAGVQLLTFNSPSFFRVLRRSIMNFRSHRKIIVVDGRIGFTGGINIIDDHSQRARGADAWRDSHVRLTGNAVHALQRVFLEDWTYALRRDPGVRGDPSTYFPFVEDESLPTEAVQIVASGPDTDRNASEAAYLDAIGRAEKRVWLTTPYFVPPDPIIAAISNAAQRGVDVRLILPRKTDNKLVDAATRTWWNSLIDRGVKLYEYQPRMVHAKTAIIDDWLAIVGSANLDYRSLRLNFEVGALLYGPKSIEATAKSFEADLTFCNVVKITRPKFFPRLAQSAARVLSPQL